MSSKITFTSLVLLFITHFELKAQYSLDDFSLDQNLSIWYDEQIGLENTILLNGEKYTFSKKSPNSHEYFKDNSWQKARIVYFDQQFESIPAIYNIENDELVIQHPVLPAYAIKLTREQVSSFSFENDDFRFIEESINFHPPGYYQVFFQGRHIELICKVSKELVIKSGILTYKLKYKPFIKLASETKYKSVRLVSHVIKMFPEEKEELKLFRKKQKIKRKLNNPDNLQRLNQLLIHCEKIMEE